jgi:hypothetical protein
MSVGINLTCRNQTRIFVDQDKSRATKFHLSGLSGLGLSTPLNKANNIERVSAQSMTYGKPQLPILYIRSKQFVFGLTDNAHS